MEKKTVKIRVLSTMYMTEVPDALIGQTFDARTITNDRGVVAYLVKGTVLNKVAPRCFTPRNQYIFLTPEVEVVE